MIKKSLNKFIILIVFSLIISSFPINNKANAEEIDTTEVVVNEIQQTLEETLEEENIMVDEFEITTEKLSLTTSLEDASGEVNSVVVEVIPGENYITIFSDEADELGNIERKEYQVNLEDIQVDEQTFEGTFEDVETGETYSYDSEVGTASIAFLIPIGIAMSPAVLTALFHTGAMIIVGGSAYVIATQAKKDKKYSHFAATVNKGGVYIGKGLSKSKAVARIQSKKDTWSTSKNQAKGVAASANPSGQPINEVDKLNGKPKKGYYWHWHPYKRTPKAHAFYGSAVK